MVAKTYPSQQQQGCWNVLEASDHLPPLFWSSKHTHSFRRAPRHSVTLCEPEIATFLHHSSWAYRSNKELELRGIMTLTANDWTTPNFL